MRKEELKKIRELLIVVDMVNGFVREGAMADPYIEHIIPNIEKMVKEFLNEEGHAAIFIKDNHEEDCKEFLRYPKHCVIGTSEALLVDELIPYEEYGYVYPKNSTSAIFAPNFLDDISKMENLEKVYGVGCCTDICVNNLVVPLQNYFDQEDRNVEIIVPMDSVETYDADFHRRDEWNNKAFDFMKQAGIKLVKTYKKEGM